MNTPLLSSTLTPEPQSRINSFTNECINTIAEFSYTCCKKAGSTVVSAALGAIGGRLIGISAPRGALQGFISAALFTWGCKPINNYIKKNAGDEPGKINKNGQDFIYTMTTVVEIALSIFMVKTFGNQILEKSKLCLPSFLSDRIIVTDKNSYTVFNGLLCFIAPMIAQHTIAYLEERQEKQRK
ncbi:MAG: hypothetical protein BGO10_09640 [Chlamydia sp. 32-24]|nr:MAG: hypothetical protein BGO10_09640 [Chlamydia sp. 32-24]